jgi:hypothetical protein
MTIRVVQQLRHDRYEVILDGFFREYIDVPALAKQESLGSIVTWEIAAPRGWRETVDLAVAENLARS